MTPDHPRAASMHHKEARRQAIAGQASTSADPATVTEMDTEDVEEALDFEEGIEDMLNDFFCDVLPNEDLIVDEEA